jgi:hypothetical protein
MTSGSRVVLFVAVAAGLPALLMGCPRKAPPAAEEAGTAPPPASTPEITELAALVDDGGADADASGAAKKWTGGSGGPGSANQQKVKACCNAMRAQAKQMGSSSPEAFQVTALAAQCDAVATQIGSQGNAPEFNQIRQILKSIKLPAACQF